MRRGYKKLTTAQIVKVHKRLEEILVRVDDEHCFYDHDFTDEKIAEEFGITANQVEHVRRGTFGKLVSPSLEPAGAVDLKARAALHLVIDILTQHAWLTTAQHEALQGIDLPLAEVSERDRS